MSRSPRLQHRSALYELTYSRIIEALRDPTALFWSFGFPILLVLTLGAAFGGGPKSHNRIALVCTAQASICDSLRKQLKADPEFQVRDEQLAHALDQLSLARFDVVIEANPVGGAQQTKLTYYFDGNSPEGRTTRISIRSLLHVPPDGYVVVDKPHVQVGRRYVDLLLPGLLAVNLMGGGIWGTSFALVDARRRGILRQLAVTPMRRSDYLLSYMIARLLFLVFEVVFLLGFGAFAFDTVLRGSWFAMTVMCLLGSFAFTGLGLLISARTESSEVASGWANALTIPMGLASGVFFDYELFPEVMHPLIRALPLTALTNGLRAIANQGVSMFEVMTQLLVLASWAVVSFAVALRIFRWR
jgi:ABC-type polysaccharide/polyol phosphate export permease